MANQLNPGAGGLPAASLADSQANPPQAQPAPPPSPLMQHFDSAQDAAAAQFGKVKEAQGKVQASRAAVDQLIKLGDTVSTEDVVKAAGGMVAAGIGAVDVATLLAGMPIQGGEALQAWVGQQAEQVAQMEAQVKVALRQAGYALGVASLKSVIGHATEAHEYRRLVNSASGRPN